MQKPTDDVAGLSVTLRNGDNVMLRRGEELGTVPLPDTEDGRPQRYLATWDGDGILYVHQCLSANGEWKQPIVTPGFKIPRMSFTAVVDTIFATEARDIEEESAHESVSKIGTSH